ncbi:MAG: hypothetical protein AAGM36_15770 [Cyanobacteria bacterium J06597_1]
MSLHRASMPKSLSPKLTIALSSRGYILVATMLMVILVMVIGIGASALSITNVSISRNVRANADTRYLAEAATDAVVGYIREEASANAYDETTVVSALIPQAESINISAIVQSCPSLDGSPCVDVDVELLHASRPDLIEIRSEILDANRDAEYSVTAIVQLREDIAPYGVDTTILSDGYVELNGLVDLRGTISDSSDDAFVHGNDGYKLSDDNELPTDPDTSNLAVTAGTSNSICDGASLIGSCQTTADISIDLLTFDEVLNEVAGTTSFPPSHDKTANNRNQLESRCRNGDIIRYYGSTINNATLEECTIIALNDLKIEGNTDVLPDTIIMAGGKIEVDGSVNFTGNNVLAARANSSSTDIGVNINSPDVSADDLLIISAGVTELNADFTSTFIAGIYSEGEVKANGNNGISGFIWSQDNIILNGTVGASSNIINSLLPTTSAYSYDAVISRN